ncbi:MAG: hypothetical protein IMW89_10710 [Ktedonobacteraceae bacterium]|nr:hypothetical protein [Ktedonobacteraceae bacterium]
MKPAHAASQSTYDALSLQFRQRLVASLMETKNLRSPTLQQAFLITPREAFVPFFYERLTDQKMEWKQKQAHQMSPEEYLALIYTDQPLVTHIDERGWPISSSSMPSVMGKMLEALDVRPGQKVLEIGTGTGYNAALLARLTGRPCLVTTIECDEMLAARAEKALQAVIGDGIAVQRGDGFQGYAPFAPYDRLIATASVSVLPQAWIEQLAPGGRLVMDLQGSLASGFLVLEKTATGAEGYFLAEPLHFMPLITKKISSSKKTSMSHLLQQPVYASFLLQKDDAFPEKFFDPAFRWFLQWRIAGCQVWNQKQVQRESGAEIHAISAIDPGSRAVVRFQRQANEEVWQGKVYGSINFWQNLQHTYEEFVSLGNPQQSSYRLIVQQAETMLITGSFSFKLPF